MANITFKLKSIPNTGLGTEFKNQWKFWGKAETKKLANLYLVLEIETKSVGTFGEVPFLVVELTEKGGTGPATDVFYEELLDNNYVGKDFTIQQLELDDAGVKIYDAGKNKTAKSLLIPREAYHNIVIARSGTSLNPDKKTWTPFTKEQVENTTDVAKFNEMVDEYNRESKDDNTVREFEFYLNAINCTGTFYEIYYDYQTKNGKDFNDVINNEFSSLTRALPLTSSKATPGSTGGDSLDNRKIELKKNLADFNKALLLKKKWTKIMKGWVLEWRQGMNLTDEEHNDKVKNWKNSWDNHPIVNQYNEIANKVLNDTKYQAQREKFDEEKRKVEDGVTAENDFDSLGKPEEVDPADDKDKRIATKDNFKKIRQLREKILTRKQAVVNLIKGLVKDDDNQKQKCPQCNNEFDTLPYNGYCSKECQNEAKGDNNKYTCTKCKQEFSGSPTIKDGKNYCSNCSTEEDKGEDNNLSKVKTNAIQAINAALSQDPKVSTSELDPDYHNWETKIKGFDNKEEINSLKELVLSDIEKKRTEKKSSKKIDEDVENLKTISESGELKEKLTEVWKNDGKVHYESKKSEVKQQEDRLFKEDPEKFKDLVKEVVTNKMSSCNVPESELDTEEKKIFTKIKNKEISDKNQLQEGKEKLIKFIGNKEADKKIESLKKEVEAAVAKGGDKKIVRSKIFSLLKEDNVYLNNKKSEINNLLKKLEGNSNINETPSPDIPWRIVIPVLIVIVVIIGIVIIRKRKNKALE